MCDEVYKKLRSGLQLNSLLSFLLDLIWYSSHGFVLICELSSTSLNRVAQGVDHGIGNWALYVRGFNDQGKSLVLPFLDCNSIQFDCLAVASCSWIGATATQFLLCFSFPFLSDKDWSNWMRWMRCVMCYESWACGTGVEADGKAQHSADPRLGSGSCDYFLTYEYQGNIDSAWYSGDHFERPITFEAFGNIVDQAC